MDAIADDPPLPLEALAAYQLDRRGWIATADRHLAAEPVAYRLVDAVDGAAHVKQVSVHPEHAGRRLGSALLDEASHWAVDRHFTSVTLTTFTEVPWNGPYYARLGFRYVREDQLGEGLRRLPAAETKHGLDLAQERHATSGVDERRLALSPGRSATGLWVHDAGVGL